MSLAIPTNANVGSTDAAGMCNRGRYSRRSAEKLISNIREQAVRGLGSNESVGKYLESLIWPFVARRSSRDEWFSHKDYGRMVKSFRTIAEKLMRLISPDNREQSYLKYWLDLALCLGVGSSDPGDLPKSGWEKEEGPLFTGILKLWVKRAIVQKDVSFLYSLQKGSKKMWPELGSVKKRAAYDKHRAALIGGETARQTPPELLLVIGDLSERVFLPMVGQPASKFLPSGGACMQAGRRDGGTLSLIDPFPLKDVLSPDDTAILDLIRPVGKLRRLDWMLNEWREEEFSKIWTRAWAQLEPTANSVPPGLFVKITAIPEPGKFRVLSLGDGFVYSALQPLQGLMLDAWKRRVESTMLRDDLTDRVNEIATDLPDLEYWCSVDYESATDLLNKDASLASLAGTYLLPGGDLGLISCMPGRAYYPRESEGKDGRIKVEYLEEDAVDVKEGQLMGHMLSFPQLCVINLAVYHRAIDLWIEQGSPEVGPSYDGWQLVSERVRRRRIGNRMRQRVLVNGDDMLFKCELSFYAVFQTVSASCGFKKSQGKQYLSKVFCMMNSQIFIQGRGVRMLRRGYLNMKLITGTSLKGGDSNALPTQITRDLNKMVALTPWTSCSVPAALNRFNGFWPDKRFRPNWYMPVHLGGLGMDPEYTSVDFTITKMQRQIAATFIADPTLVLFRRQGNSMPLAKLGAALSKWTWIKGDYVPNNHENFDQDDEWMNRMAYAYRASLSHAPELYTETSDYHVARIVIQHRLKPMTDKTIALYRNARLIGTRLPSCPPLAPIRVPREDLLPVLFEQGWSKTIGNIRRKRERGRARR